MTDIAKRLTKLRKTKYRFRSEFAREIGVTPQTARDWENGKIRPNGGNLKAIAKALNTTPAYLLTGVMGRKLLDGLYLTDSDDDTFIIECMDIDIPCPLIEQIEHPDKKGKYYVDEASDRRVLRLSEEKLLSLKIQPENIVAVVINDRCMLPYLPEGTLVAIDTANKNIADGNVYCLVLKNELLKIKSLYKVPDGKIKLRSFNRHDFEDEVYNSEDIRIIGRLFWSSVYW